MRISFVVPAYNEETYLPDCLDSILAQTRDLPAGSVEIIVVNNASTDRTREVALSYPGVQVVDEPRKGLTHARQAGFAASTGELIANVDSDSRLTPGWLAQVLSTFAAEPKLVALSGPFVYYDLTPKQRTGVQLFYAAAFPRLRPQPLHPPRRLHGPRAATSSSAAMRSSRSAASTSTSPSTARTPTSPAASTASAGSSSPSTSKCSPPPAASKKKACSPSPPATPSTTSGPSSASAPSPTTTSTTANPSPPPPIVAEQKS
jgi:hypothetical protein